MKPLVRHHARVLEPHSLVGAVLADQHDEWAEGRRYLGLDVLGRARITTVPATADGTKEASPTTAIPALRA